MSAVKLGFVEVMVNLSGTIRSLSPNVNWRTACGPGAWFLDLNRQDVS